MAERKGSCRVVSVILDKWDPVVRAIEPSNDPLDAQNRAALSDAQKSIFAHFNMLVDRLGKRFADGDQLFEESLDAISASDFQVFLRGGKPDASAYKSVNSAANRTIIALNELASRHGYNPNTSSAPRDLSSTFDDSEEPSFCKAAVIYQRALRSHNPNPPRIFSSHSQQLDFTCTHCYLSLSDYTWRADPRPPKQWNLLTACHILACTSLQDRRAALCCFACLEKGKVVASTSMIGFEKHLNGCPNLKELLQQPPPQVHTPKPDHPHRMPEPLQPSPSRPSRGSEPIYQANSQATASRKQEPVPTANHQSTRPLMPHAPPPPPPPTGSWPDPEEELSPGLPPRPGARQRSQAALTRNPLYPSDTWATDRPKSADQFLRPGAGPPAPPLKQEPEPYNMPGNFFSDGFSGGESGRKSEDGFPGAGVSGGEAGRRSEDRGEGSDQDVHTIMEILHVSRRDAKKKLAAAGGDVERAINNNV